MQNISPLLVDITSISCIADISTDNSTTFSSSGSLPIPTTFSLSYSIGSIIIIHNLLPSNSKTLITYHEYPIIFLKHFPASSHLMSIDSSGLCVIWQFPSLHISTTFTLTQSPSCQFTHIFHGHFRKDKLLLLGASSYSKRNILYEFNSYEFTFRSLCTDIVQNEEVLDLKPFYNSSDLVIMTSNSIIYYHLTTTDTLQQFQFCFDVKFNYNLIVNSLKVSAVMNYIAFVTERGSVLVYDQNGNGKPSLVPNDSSAFMTCEFSKDLLLCGSDNGRVYCYSIYEQVLVKCVEAWKEALNGKREYSLCKGMDDTDVNEETNSERDIGKRNKMKMCIEKIFISGDCLLLINKDNSMLLMNISEGGFNANGIYVYGHSKEVTCVATVKSENSFNEGTLFYTAGYDQSIQTVNINLQCDKIVNYYLSDAIHSHAHNTGSNYNDIVHNSNMINTNNNNIYITALKVHPTYTNKLFAGDNKGSLYLFDLKENIFQYKKYIANTFAITSISFDNKCEYICIGFDTGMNVLCDLNNECEFLSKINDHFLSPTEIDLRKTNHQTTSFSYFLPQISNIHYLFFLKSQSEIELCSISANTPQPHRTIRIEGIIIDINIHSSNNYSIALTQRRLIVINSISNGEVTAVIDVTSQIHTVYNFAIDSSGLYLALVCDVKGYKGACGKRSNVVFFEIGTGKVQCYIDGVFEMSEVKFDEGGKYVLIGVSGSNGGVSLWKLPSNMRDAIYNVKEQIKVDENFWEMYEIRYDDNDGDIENYYNRNYKYGNSEWGSIASRSSVNVFGGDVNRDIKSMHSKNSGALHVENVFENNLKNSAEGNIKKEMEDDEEKRINTLRNELMEQDNKHTKHNVIEHKPQLLNDNKKENDMLKHLNNRNVINHTANPLPHFNTKSTHNNNNNSLLNPKLNDVSIFKHKPQNSFKTEISSNKRYNFPSYFDLNPLTSNKPPSFKGEDKKEESPIFKTRNINNLTTRDQHPLPQNPFLNSLECSSESKQRITKINQAIAQILQPQQSNKEEVQKEPVDIDESSVHTSNITESVSSVKDLKYGNGYGKELKFSTQTFANERNRIKESVGKKANKDYYINSKNITKAYPEPEDIDDVDGDNGNYEEDDDNKNKNFF